MIEALNEAKLNGSEVMYQKKGFTSDSNSLIVDTTDASGERVLPGGEPISLCSYCGAETIQDLRSDTESNSLRHLTDSGCFTCDVQSWLR